MNKNLIVVAIIFAGLLILGSVAWVTQPKLDKDEPPVEVTPTILTANKSAHDFGRISMARGVVKNTFVITNPSARAVTVKKIFTSCMCTKATLFLGGRAIGPFGMPGHGSTVPEITELFPAGGTGELVVEFDPAAHGPSGVGLIERAVTVETLDNSPLIVGFQALVTP